VAFPPRPAVIDSAHAPDGVEVKFVTFADSRPDLPGEPSTLADDGIARSIFIHTNAAQREGSIESAWNHTHGNPGVNTLPHYQVDRTHDGVTRARKMLDSSQKGIANKTVRPGSDRWDSLTDAQQAEIRERGDVQWWSLAIETADRGSIADPYPTGSFFDEGQIETIAAIVAYESLVHGFPLVMVTEWWDTGVASHTDPDTYPFTTIHPGKSCPGDRKKVQVRNLIIPRAIQIQQAWLGPIDPNPVLALAGSEGEGMFIAKTKDGKFFIGNGLARRQLADTNDINQQISMGTFRRGLSGNAADQLIDLASKKSVNSADDVTNVSDAGIARLGVQVN